MSSHGPPISTTVLCYKDEETGRGELDLQCRFYRMKAHHARRTSLTSLLTLSVLAVRLRLWRRATSNSRHQSSELSCETVGHFYPDSGSGTWNTLSSLPTRHSSRLLIRSLLDSLPAGPFRIGDGPRNGTKMSRPSSCIGRRTTSSSYPSWKISRPAFEKTMASTRTSSPFLPTTPTWM